MVWFKAVMDAFGGSILGGVKDLISEFHMSPEDKAKLADAMAQREHELQMTLMSQVTAQLEVNKAEAQNTNWFVSGWRPYVGWVCGSGLAYQFIAQPLLAWAALMASVPTPPPLDMSTLITVLTGMLGLGVVRMQEKVRGVARG